MRMVDIIIKKKEGLKLSREEIEFFVRGVTDGSIPDYQASSLLMAICLKGMDDEETLNLTLAMVASGDTIDLSEIPKIKVDKHSTGGVGDKTTMILGPMVAALGVPVAKMSGRGLGHTGGTIDKLESIPGVNTQLSQEEFIKIVQDIGLAVAGQTGNLVPADKKLYALRDVTGTVESIPLISASIMSKKLASGSDAIVLDVKVGSGAFMKTTEDAQKLAKAMVEIGSGAKRKTVAVITDMDRPLGKAVGNALEVKEAIEVLSGNGSDDITEVCITLAAKMLELAGMGDFNKCARLAEGTIKDGSALEKFKQMIKAQNGNEEVVDNPELLPSAKYTTEYRAASDGYIFSIISDRLGVASMLLGAGRATKESVIDPGAGITLLKKPGEMVKAGEPIMMLHANSESLFKDSLDELEKAVVISREKPPQTPLIIDIIQ
ncbi:MAG TPA: pyrimidine-nucleoside phosphorylase [Clostridiaceae bacterium]|jgi:pyrimidine-nucleoside phosphorylase|nr:pyrimidine-nucleoside phosphorylase [Clostridiaceae bacterium]